MSDDTAVIDCCGACFGICSLICCESVLVALNFKKPGSRAGSTQRGCCRNLGEATEDDVFEEDARRQRVADLSKKHQNGKVESEAGGDEGVSEQPTASPEMTPTTAATTTATTPTKPDTDEAK